MTAEQHPLYNDLNFIEQCVLESEMGEDFYKEYETQEELEGAILESLLGGQHDY